MKKLIILFAIFSLYGCDKTGMYDIMIINNSESELICSLSRNEEIFDLKKLLIANEIEKGKKYERIDITSLFLSTIKADTTSNLNERPISWNRFINSSKHKKIRLYIIKKDSVNKYGWEGIHARNLYNKKYTLDMDDLDSLNWTIEYNGN